jgi:hypothetical protein
MRPVSLFMSYLKKIIINALNEGESSKCNDSIREICDVYPNTSRDTIFQDTLSSSGACTVKPFYSSNQFSNTATFQGSITLLLTSCLTGSESAV